MSESTTILYEDDQHFDRPFFYVNAIDPDSNSHIHYRIADGDNQKHFTIDANTGTPIR